MSSAKHRQETETSEASTPARKPRDFRAAYLVVPALAVLAAIILYPIASAIFESTRGKEGLNPATGMFESGGSVGFQNYLNWLLNRCMGADGQVITCPDGVPQASLWPAIGNTLFLTVVTVSLEIVLGLFMAIIMSRNVFGRSLLRAAVLIPWAIPTAVTATLWKFLFAPMGLVNSLIPWDIGWTTDYWPSRFAVIVADVWKTTPFMALLILAGLQMIPKDVYEAARVDGAGPVARLLRITLPMIKPALAVAILFRTLDALRMFDLPYLMIGSATTTSTSTISMVIADQVRKSVPEASALSTMTFLAIFVIAFLLIKALGANVVERNETR